MIPKPTASTAVQRPDLWNLCLAFTEHAPLPMAALEGPDHLVRQVNPAFCRLLEQPREQLIGKPFRELLPSKDACVRLLDRVYRTGRPEQHTEQHYSNPQPVLWSYMMWPVRLDERPLGVMLQVAETTKFHEQTVAMNEALILGSVHQHELTEAAVSLNTKLQVEISERKQAEEALQRAQAQLSDRAGQLEGLVAERTAELTATNKQLEALVYSIAHDLRAPLRSMQGFATLLVAEAGAALSETSRDFAGRIDTSARFMDALLRDLLAFSGMAQRRIEMAQVNLERVIQSTLSRLGKEIETKNARVEVAGPWPTVLAHAPTVEQILMNLFGNALKFVRPEAPPQIRLRAEEHGLSVRVWVEDNGIGLAPEHRKQIFGLFTRLHESKFPGTGVGLAIVQKGAERMGGSAGVESTLGQGSGFWFELRKVIGANEPRDRKGG